MNTVDILVLVVVLLNGAIGAFRGFTWQAFRLGSLVLGLFLGSRYSEPLADRVLSRFLSLDATGQRVLAWGVIFVLTYALMHLVGMLLKRLIDRARLTSTDRSLGFLLGGLKGSVFVVLTFQVMLIFFQILPSSVKTQLTGSTAEKVPASQAFRLHHKWAYRQINAIMPADLAQDAVKGASAFGGG